jgi:hypothetical protein
VIAEFLFFLISELILKRHYYNNTSNECHTIIITAFNEAKKKKHTTINTYKDSMSSMYSTFVGFFGFFEYIFAWIKV